MDCNDYEIFSRVSPACSAMEAPVDINLNRANVFRQSTGNTRGKV